MLWLTENLSTIIICLILAVIMGLIIFSMIRNKKKGKCSCGNSCGCCPMGGSCHGEGYKKIIEGKNTPLSECVPESEVDR